MSNIFTVSLTSDAKENIDFYRTCIDFEDKNLLNELNDLKAEEMINGLGNMIRLTNRELMDYFTVKEATCIVAALNGNMYNSESSSKIYLYINTFDSIQLDGFAGYYGIEPEIILDKIEKLTEFQAFCIIQMSFNYFYDDDFGWDFNSKCLKHIFLISDEKVE